VVVDRGPWVVFSSGCAVVNRGTCVLLEQCYMCLWFSVRVWYLISGFIVVDCGPGEVLEQWLCGSESRSVRGLRAVTVWYLIGVRAW
jgi:hypothetical protein